MSNHKKIELDEHIIEIVSDSGEGAQKAAHTFAHASAKMGNYLWTVEIIPSEIQPPPHTTGSASGNRIRVASEQVTNAGNLTNVVLAFNEMALLSRIEAGALRDDVLVIIDNVWATHQDEEIQQQYREILDKMKDGGATIYEVPITEETLKVLDDARRGKNMYALGVLAFLYNRDIELLKGHIKKIFGKKSAVIQQNNIALLQNGYDYAKGVFDFQYEIAGHPHDEAMITINGNQAIALGAVAAGFEVCAMYPITPATSASHYLSEIFEEFGGIVHQAEDEIAAVGVALGAAYGGKHALTITSGPGMALKTETLGLTVISETPLVVVNVQRGGPSTGLPTKIEQGDLLSALYSTPGDAPKVVIAPSTIEECFHIMATARKIADEFRMLVIVLTDANLATGMQMFKRPEISASTMGSSIDQTAVPNGTLPYDWDETTGMSRRLIPGQPGGMNVTTSLNHSSDGKIKYDSVTNQHAHRMRSRKLAALQKTLKAPEIFGDDVGDLLLVCWGSTRGAVEEACDAARKEGLSVSAINLRFLSPLPPGLKQVFQKFKKVITVELNYSDDWGDPLVDEESRRYSQLARVLRERTLIDIDCFSRVYGRPLMPDEILEAIREKMQVQVA